MKQLTDALLQDFWVHVGGILAIAFGAADLWQFRSLGHDADLIFLIGGFGVMGVKIINGSAATLRAAVTVAPAIAAALAPAVVAAVVPALAPQPPPPPPG